METVTHWYEVYSPIIGDPQLPQSRMFDRNMWYTGISSNPVLSLKAHNVDLKNKLGFICNVVSVKNAAEIKQAVMSLSYFEHCSEDKSDHICEEQAHTYLYSFLVKEDSVFEIDASGFAPLKYMPQSPAEFFIYQSDGSRKKKSVQSEERDSYPEVVEKILGRCRKGGVEKLIVRSPRYHKLLLCKFEDGGCGFDVYFDPKGAAGGFVQRLELAENVEDPWGLLSEIVMCALTNDDIYRKVRWRSVRMEIEL